MNNKIILRHTKFFKLAIWYYRLIGITFGGIVLSEKQLKSNQFYNIYGYLMSSVLTAANTGAMYFCIKSTEFNEIYNSGIHFTYYAIVGTFILVSTEVVVNIWFLQLHGMKMIKLLVDFRIHDSRCNSFIIFLWFAHIILPLIVLPIEIQSTDWKLITIILRCLSRVLYIPSLWTHAFITWIISISVSEYIRNLRRILSLSDTRNWTHLSMVRKSFVETRRVIFKLDQSMALIHIISTVTAITMIMVQVYILSISRKYAILHRFENMFIFCTITAVVKLIANCLINGQVHDEADKLLATIDDIDLNDSKHDLNFKETLVFMSISRDIRYGFTIANLMPLRRTTLLSIFSFILMYSVILIQTGAI